MLCSVSSVLTFRIEVMAGQTLLVLASLTENKDRAPTCSCDQQRVGSSQDKVPFSGELQYQLPAPPQTSGFGGDNWPLARPQRTPMEVCPCSSEQHSLHIISQYPACSSGWHRHVLWTSFTASVFHSENAKPEQQWSLYIHKSLTFTLHTRCSVGFWAGVNAVCWHVGWEQYKMS